MRTDHAFDRLSRTSNPVAFGIFYTLLRIALGALFLMAGIAKMSGWSASAFLEHASGPFASWFQSLAGSSFIDGLNVFALTALGIALVLGLCVRPAAIGGVILMVLYYFAQFTENTAHGYIDEHIIYALVLALFAAGGAGHVFGLNGMVLHAIRKPSAFARFIFG